MHASASSSIVHLPSTLWSQRDYGKMGRWMGVRALDNLCADLAHPSPEPEEEDEQVDNVEVRISATGCEDQLESFNMPKRKWKRKIYPDSTVRWSARIRTAKKFHDEI